MPDDFPAAHSMDTQWFAVDADGHVAVLHSGEEGPVPEGVDPHEPAVHAWLRSLCPESAGQEWWSAEDDDIRRVGLFGYGHSQRVGWFTWPYQRELVPDQPRHIDQMPPKVREIFSRVRFDKLRFADSAYLQPAEFFPCHLWDDEPAYLASDGRTVRAVPGEEDRFWGAYRYDHAEYQREYTKLAGQLRIELPPGPPPKEDEDEDDDYPAAHSMDTTWFAVDQDGHVGCFTSGENGVVPTAAATATFDVWPEHWPAPVAGDTEVGQDLPGRLMPGPLGRTALHWSKGQRSSREILFFLTSLEPIRKELAAGKAIQVPAREGVAVLFGQVSYRLASRLHQEGVCLGCFPYPEEDELALSRSGVFAYEHLDDDRLPGPYGRACYPLQPVHIDQLAPALRRQFLQLRFASLCFLETPHLQPAEHTECHSHGATIYLAADGVHIRPLRGHEDEYRNNYEAMRAQMPAWASELILEPPPFPAKKKRKR
jgi:hypothetical protein